MSEQRATEAVGPALTSSSIPAVRGESLAATAQSEPDLAPDGIAPSEAGIREGHVSFGSFAHQQVRDYIQLADQKAAFLFAASAAMLAFLHAGHAASQWLIPWGTWDWMSAVSVAAMFGLSASVVLAAATVLPRTKGSKEGLLFWLAVAQRSSGDQYAREIIRASDTALTEATLTHTYELAKVCEGKYATLRWAFRTAGVGFGGAVVYLLFVTAA